MPFPLPPILYHDGASHTVTPGNYLGTNAYRNYPPGAFSDADSATAAITVTAATNVTFPNGTGTCTGGNGLAAINPESDETPDLDLGGFAAAPGLESFGNNTLTIAGNWSFTGGDAATGAMGYLPHFGAPGGRIVGIDPNNVSITSQPNFTGGSSNSAVEGPAALEVEINSTNTLILNLGNLTGGSGSGQGPSLAVANGAAGRIEVKSCGTFTGVIACAMSAGSSLRFYWSTTGTLSTSSVSGALHGGGTLSSVSITGSSGATVAAGTVAGVNYSELQF